MKKTVLLFFILFLSVPMMAQIKYVENSFRSTNAADIETGGSEIGQKNMTSSLMTFLDDYDGTGKKCGIVRVKFEHMANEDIDGKWKCSVTQGKHIQDPKYQSNKGSLEYWIQVDPGENLDLTFTHDDGLGSVTVPGLKIESETMYTLTLQSQKTTPISFSFSVDGVKVTLDNKYIGESPCQAERITYGKHHAIYEYKGRRETREIEVSESNIAFGDDVEFRNKYPVHFKSNEKNAYLIIDDENIGKMPLDVDVFEGAHTLKAYSDRGLSKEESITVGPNTKEHEIELYQTKYIDFYSNYDNSRVSGATVYINGDKRGETPYQEKLEYGKYKIRMTYSGKDKSGSLVVDDNTANDFSLNIPPHKNRWNPFDIEFREREYGLSVAYVSKWWSGKYDGQSYRMNCWGDDAAMSGIQIGVPVQPIFGYGLGLSTGLFYEIYFSSYSYSDRSYEEMDLYIPVHLIFRLPIANEFSIFVNGGIGMDFGLSAKLKEDGYEDYKLSFGEEDMQNMFNLSGEFGGGVQYKAFQLSANYSMGLLDHGSFADGFDKITQNKLAISLSVLF